MPPSVSSRTATPPAPSTRVRSSPRRTSCDDVVDELVDRRDVDAAQARRRLGASASSRRTSSCTSVAAATSRARSRRRWARRRSRRSGTGLTTLTRWPSAAATRGKRRGGTVLPTPVPVPGDDDEPHAVLAHLARAACRRGRGLPSVQVGPGGDAQPATPVGHRRRPEAADAGARGRAAVAARPARLARPRHRHGEHSTGRRRVGRRRRRVAARADGARCGRSGSSAHDRATAARRTGRGGRQSGVVDERASGVDQVVDDGGSNRGRHRPGCPGPSTASWSRRRRGVRRGPWLATSPAPSLPATPIACASSTTSTASYVSASRGQLGQRCGVAEHGVDRLDEHERARLGPRRAGPARLR